MRARNLKPQLFTNELLATADPLYTTTFAGLWCYCDREGRGEDRPQRIHLAVNPGRAYERTLEALDWLAANGFIVRYQVGKGRYLWVPMFRKHQNPHYKEPPSVLPTPPIIDDSALGFDPDDSGGNPGQEGQSSDEPDPIIEPKPEAYPPTIGGETRLIPDSGFRIPDSPSLPFPSEPGKGGPSDGGNGTGEHPPRRRSLGTNPRANGENPRALGTNGRAVKNLSAEMWGATLVAVDEIKGTEYTWAHARKIIGDELAHQAIEQIGGYKRIADRTKFDQGELKQRFRDAYEQLLERGRSPEPPERATA